MKPKFEHLEAVRVTGEGVVGPKQKRLTGETGFVSGCSNPYEDGHRDFGVHFNSLGEVVCISEEDLESLGRIALPREIVTRSRARGARMPDEGEEQP